MHIEDDFFDEVKDAVEDDEITVDSFHHSFEFSCWNKPGNGERDNFTNFCKLYMFVRNCELFDDFSYELRFEDASGNNTIKEIITDENNKELASKWFTNGHNGPNYSDKSKFYIAYTFIKIKIEYNGELSFGDYAYFLWKFSELLTTLCVKSGSDNECINDIIIDGDSNTFRDLDLTKTFRITNKDAWKRLAEMARIYHNIFDSPLEKTDFIKFARLYYPTDRKEAKLNASMLMNLFNYNFVNKE